MTDASYNCIDVLATARCAEVMDSHDPSCALDHALIGPALSLAINGVPIVRSRIPQAKAQIEESAKALKEQFLAIAPDTPWPKNALRPSTVSLTKVFDSLGVRTRFGRNDNPTLARDILRDIKRDPKTPDAALPLVNIVLKLADMEADRRALDLLEGGNVVHNVPLLGAEWTSSGLWSDQPDFMRESTQALINVPEGYHLHSVNVLAPVWHHFTDRNENFVCIHFDGKRKKDPKIEANLSNREMVYAPTAAAIAREKGITRKQAQELMDLFHQNNPTLALWHEEVFTDIREKRMLRNPFGRTRRTFGRIWEEGYLRECLRWLIDSTESDIAHLIVYHLWKHQMDVRILAHSGCRILLMAPKHWDWPSFTFAGQPVNIVGDF